MTAYATVAEYRALYPDAAEDAAAIGNALDRASREVDALTFCRIVTPGVDGLTGHQRELVGRAVCAQAHFGLAYGELLDSPLASYGINGVSMGFRDGAVLDVGGVSTNNEVVSLLRQTGLTWRGVR